MVKFSAEPAQQDKEELMLLSMYPTEWDLPEQDKKELMMLLGLSEVEWEVGKIGVLSHLLSHHSTHPTAPGHAGGCFFEGTRS